MLLALLRKKPLRVRYLRIFSAVYTIAVWAVWQFLTYDGNAVRTMPALLWGYVFYRLARSVLEKKPVPAIPKERWYTCLLYTSSANATASPSCFGREIKTS